MSCTLFNAMQIVNLFLKLTIQPDSVEAERAFRQMSRKRYYLPA